MAEMNRRLPYALALVLGMIMPATAGLDPARTLKGRYRSGRPISSGPGKSPGTIRRQVRARQQRDS
jgi:hypothetical protein